MNERYDLAIIGSGPAGLSAALNAQIRKKKFIIFGTNELSGKLTKAEKVNNYLGFYGKSGKEIRDEFNNHLKSMDIKITEEIQALYSTHEEIIKNKSYQDVYKNDKVSNILKENYLVLRNVFEKFGTKKEKTEITEMTVTQLLSFASTLSKKFQFNLGKMTEGDAKCEKNIDFFDFMRIVVAMSTNLFDASSPEQSTEKLLGYIKSIAE